MKAFVFPGQGSQFSGMGKDLFDQSENAKKRFSEADELLGFSISDTMFNGTAEDLKQTQVTQPAIFLHSVIMAEAMGSKFKPDMVAGHSLGEFSALVAAGALNFKNGLELVAKRANAMQKATEKSKGTMAAVLGLDEEIIEKICGETEGILVAANYNCPGQVVISGATEAVETACEKLKESGARRAMVLPVGGAFHSPLMEPAREELATAIENTELKKPSCAIYQNVSAKAVTDPAVIKVNLVAQLTSPVKWTQTMQNMIADGAQSVVEVGPGKVLQGLFKKMDRSFETASAEV
jgi:[acyl-carrier-protein] S-malonyltransferase